MIARTLLNELKISPERCVEIISMISPHLERGEGRKVIYNTIMTAGLTEREKLLAFYLWGCEEGYIGYQIEEGDTDLIVRLENIADGLFRKGDIEGFGILANTLKILKEG